MAGNPRENEIDKGFWDGGSKGQSNDDQSSGRRSGYPGPRGAARLGHNTDLERQTRDGNAPSEESVRPDGGTFAPVTTTTKG